MQIAELFGFRLPRLTRVIVPASQTFEERLTASARILRTRSADAHALELEALRTASSDEHSAILDTAAFYSDLGRLLERQAERVERKAFDAMSDTQRLERAEAWLA
jgi:hypothetical protein